MAKRMLVPLDQTPAAETVVPLVAETARGAGATVRLLHVAPMPDNVLSADGRVVAFADQELSRLEAEGLDYLRTVEAQFDGVPVESAVRFGDPVAQILAEAAEFGADLIALTTGHHTNLNRLLLGSTAEQVARRTSAAVVMYRPAAS